MSMLPWTTWDGSSDFLQSDKSFPHPVMVFRHGSVNGDTNDNATLSATTSPLMPAYPRSRMSVKFSTARTIDKDGK